MHATCSPVTTTLCPTLYWRSTECYSMGVCKGTSNSFWWKLDVSLGVWKVRRLPASSCTFTTAVMGKDESLFHADGWAPSVSPGNTLRWKPGRAAATSATSLSRQCNSLTPMSCTHCTLPVFSRSQVSQFCHFSWCEDFYHSCSWASWTESKGCRATVPPQH